jgi:hypothetical protein
MVIYRSGDGQPGYHQAEELDEAAKFVERLRNGDGVDSARIFHMEEVNFDFRPYFKVEIDPSGEPIQTPVADMGPGPAPAAQPEPAPGPGPAVPPEPTPEPAPLADAPGPAPSAPSSDAWGDLGGDSEAEPTPLIEQAESFMPDTSSDEPPPADGNGNGTDSEEGVGARRGLFGR